MQRTRPVLRLSRSPLVYVVAQVRFSAVESIPKYIPELQDEFRRQFPRFERGELRHLRLSPAAAPEMSSIPRFEFQNRERNCGIIVQRESVTVHCSRYESFEVLCKTLRYALDTVHSVVGLGLIERIGLRYVDLVRPAIDEQLSDYLHPGLLGINDNDVGASKSLKMFVYQGETEPGVLVFRMTQRNDGVILPPDVEPGALRYKESMVFSGETITLLDFDHFREFSNEPLDFSADIALEYLWRLHNNTELAFRAAVSERALVAWGMEKNDAAD